jgi:UDP-N-acetylmuramate-alanine ligase
MKGVGTDIGTIHFIGIGGIGMSGIAEVMHILGYKVQGSDVAKAMSSRACARQGIRSRSATGGQSRRRGRRRGLDRDPQGQSRAGLRL